MLEFGQEFKLWLSTQQKTDPVTQVSNHLCFEIVTNIKVILNVSYGEIFLQAQQILRMWTTLHGDKLTEEQIIAALNKMPKTENLIFEIKKRCS